MNQLAETIQVTDLTSNSLQTIIAMDTTNNITDTMSSGDDTSTSKVITSSKINDITV